MSVLLDQRELLRHGGEFRPTSIPGRRARRVVVLLVAIVALSIADLVATISHLRIGMIEGNPLARFIIETTNSIGALAAFKAATVLVCVVLLFRLRRSRQGEAAAWMAAFILCALTVWWGFASEQLTHSEVIATQIEQLAGAGAGSRAIAAPLP